MLGVLDLKKTIEFYTSALDFEVTGSFEHDGKLVWAEFASAKRWLVCDNPILMCNQIPPECIGPDDRRTKKNMIFYYYPFNVVELHATLREKGFAVSELRVTIYGMKEFEMEDPDGYQLWFGEGTDEPPTERC